MITPSDDHQRRDCHLGEPLEGRRLHRRVRVVMQELPTAVVLDHASQPGRDPRDLPRSLENRLGQPQLLGLSQSTHPSHLVDQLQVRAPTARKGILAHHRVNEHERIDQFRIGERKLKDDPATQRKSHQRPTTDADVGEQSP